MSIIEFKSWVVEQASPDLIYLYRRVGGLAATQSPFQAIEFAKTAAYGEMLLLDSAIQSTAVDEYLYHEALVHPGLISHPQPQRVLIIGGGEGAALREVLKHPSVASVVMVDIDRALVEFCQQNLISWHQNAFDDPRVSVVYDDGRAYLERSLELFDVMITDITDAVVEGPAVALYTQEFYALCRDRLTDNGVLVVQAFALSAIEWNEHATIARTIRSIFPNARSYQMFIRSFNSTWGFVMADKTDSEIAIDTAEIARRLSDRGLASKLRAYDEITHAGMLIMPKDLRSNLRRSGSILQDGKPLMFDP